METRCWSYLPSGVPPGHAWKLPGKRCFTPLQGSDFIVFGPAFSKQMTSVMHRALSQLTPCTWCLEVLQGGLLQTGGTSGPQEFGILGFEIPLKRVARGGVEAELSHLSRDGAVGFRGIELTGAVWSEVLAGLVAHSC